MRREATVLLVSGLVVGFTGLIALQSLVQETRPAWSAGNLGLSGNATHLAAQDSHAAGHSHGGSLPNTLFESPPPIPGLCGDVAPSAECDGVVDVGDSTLLHNYVGYPGDYSLCCDACGDVAPSGGCDGVIDVADFILLLNYVLYPGQYDLCCEGEAAAMAPAARAVVPAGGAAAAENEVTFVPEESSAPYGKSTEVEIWVDAADFRSGQIEFAYDSTCADVTDWERNTDDFLYGGWESDTPGEEWIVFIAEGPLSGEHLVGTLTVDFVSEEECTTAFDFVEPSLLSDDFGNDVPATWVDGTFKRG